MITMKRSWRIVVLPGPYRLSAWSRACARNFLEEGEAGVEDSMLATRQSTCVMPAGRLPLARSSFSHWWPCKAPLWKPGLPCIAPRNCRSDPGGGLHGVRSPPVWTHFSSLPLQRWWGACAWSAPKLLPGICLLCRLAGVLAMIMMLWRCIVWIQLIQK